MMIKFLVTDIWRQHPKNLDVVRISCRVRGMGHSAIEINFGSERKQSGMNEKKLLFQLHLITLLG